MHRYLMPVRAPPSLTPFANSNQNTAEPRSRTAFRLQAPNRKGCPALSVSSAVCCISGSERIVTDPAPGALSALAAIGHLCDLSGTGSADEVTRLALGLQHFISNGGFSTFAHACLPATGNNGPCTTSHQIIYARFSMPAIGPDTRTSFLS
jgi:hypothetical protein